jgi:hypothetical protein
MSKPNKKPARSNCHLKAELFCAKIIFLILLSLAMAVLFSFLLACAGIRLPNRDHPNCAVPYSQRPLCVSTADCSMGFQCAYRGHALGRCTYEDCCDPWRNRRLERGDTFCNDKNRDQRGNICKPCRSEVTITHER